MKSVKVNLKDCIKSVQKCICLLALSTFMFGCQKATPPVTQDDVGLAREMKAWFEAVDYEASSWVNLEEVLNAIYQDDGYTVSLYNKLEALLNQTDPGRAAYSRVFKECQEWFEMIDYERSGYNSLEEAIKDIYQDNGATLELYKRLVKWNTRGD